MLGKATRLLPQLATSKRPIQSQLKSICDF